MGAADSNFAAFWRTGIERMLSILSRTHPTDPVMLLQELDQGNVFAGITPLFRAMFAATVATTCSAILYMGQTGHPLCSETHG